MMAESATSGKDESKQAVSRRRVLRTMGAGISIALFGAAPAGAQQTLDFGDVVTGSSEIQTVSQPNPTGQPLPVTGIEITGSDADQFSVVGGDAPFTLQPGESRTIDIQFAPISVGEKSGTIQVEIGSRASQTAGQLTGTGVNEAADETADTAATDDSSSSSSSQETTTPESATDASDDSPSADDTPSTEAETGTTSSADESQSDGDDSSTEGTTDAPTDKMAVGDADSSVEDSATTESDLAESTPALDGKPSITLILDFDGDGTVDLRDILTLIRTFS